MGSRVSSLRGLGCGAQRFGLQISIYPSGAVLALFAILLDHT